MRAPTSVWEIPSRAAGIGTVVWRLAVCGVVAGNPVLNWRDLWFLDQSGSLFVAVCYAVMAGALLMPGGRRIEPGLAWLRGALASMMVFCVAAGLNSEETGFDQVGFWLALSTLVILVDVAFVGRTQLRARLWYPVSWIVFPLLYVIAVNAAGTDHMMYGGILDPGYAYFDSARRHHRQVAPATG